MIPVSIVGLHVERQSGGTVLLLREIDAEDRVLPIFIGPNEARAIVLAANEVTPPRPYTHDLLMSVLESLDAELVRVDVTDLTDGTFIAELELLRDGATQRVSCRPSDAIALATRNGAPIYVDPQVLDDAGVHVQQEPEELDETAVESIVSEFQEFLETASPSDFVEPETPELEAGPTAELERTDDDVEADVDDRGDDEPDDGGEGADEEE